MWGSVRGTVVGCFAIKYDGFGLVCERIPNRLGGAVEFSPLFARHASAIDVIGVWRLGWVVIGIDLVINVVILKIM